MDVELPDGTVITGVPEGTTRAQLEAKLGRVSDSPKSRGASGSWAGTSPDESSSNPLRGGKLDAVLTGIRDPIDALAQLAPRGLSAVASLGGLAPNRVSNFMDSEARRVDEMVRGNEADYQAGRAANDREGIDLLRVAGNVASPANLAAGAGATRAVSMIPKAGALAKGAATGAVYGGLQPVTEGDSFARTKAAQLGTGAAVGGAFPLLSRVVKPNTSAHAKTLLDEGVQLTPGQILGGGFKRAEDAASSIPIMGDAIRGAQARSLESFNRAALQRALGPVGETLPKGVMGREGLAHVEKALGDKYNAILPKLQFKPDQQFSAEFTQLQQMAAQLPEAQAKQFERVIRDKLVNKMTPQGNMNGESFKAAESELNRIAEGYRSSADFDTRELGNALKSVIQSARNTLVRGNPQYADELAKINEGYANFSRLRRAAGSVAAEDGLFTPAQLHNAVKAKSGGVDKSQFARGDALMQDLSEAGRSVLPSRVPDSGTMTRAAVAGMTLNPALIPGVVAGAAGYSAPAQILARALLTKRPAAAGPIAEALPRASAPVAALASQLMQYGAQ